MSSLPSFPAQFLHKAGLTSLHSSSMAVLLNENAVLIGRNFINASRIEIGSEISEKFADEEKRDFMRVYSSVH